MNPKLNKKVKKFLDAYFKGTSASSPEAHHALMFILKGALTDANFHSTSKKVDKLFPKAKNAKYFGKRDWEDSLEDKGVDIATMAKWDGHDIIDAVGFFVSMYVGGPLGKKIEALKNESFKREHKLLENLSVLVEKNVPTNPSKWSYYKSQAKKKFDVYPSAYANAWAAKQYKAAGGGWRKTKGESITVPEEDTVAEKVSVFDERPIGKKGIIIMIDDGGKKVSAIFKDKKNADKFNRNNPSDIKKLLQLAKGKKFPQTIDESINEVRFSVIAKYGGYEMVEKSNQSAFIISKSGKIVGQLKRTSKYLKDDIKRFIKMVKDGKIKNVKSYKFIESVINEISAEGGLKRVIKGQTREVEGIKLYVPMAQAMLDWFNSSPYGRKYPRAKKARLHLSLGIMMGFGLDRYAKHKGAREELKYIKTLAKAMREDNTLRESTIKHLQSLKEGKYNFKDDAMNAYMKGKISAKELDKIAKNDFKSSVATKQELQNFLKSGYMKELMANTYGLKVPAMEKKVKELMKYAS